MKDWGTVTSSKQPETLEIDKYSVWVASDIRQIEIPSGTEESSEPDIGWEYKLVQYDKDEYITMMNDNISSTQEAVDYLLMNQQ